MDTKPFTSGLSENAVMITRVADRQWHALHDDLVVGRGHAEHRPDGRLFVSIDAWHDATFDRLVEAMLPELPVPLYTVVDEAHIELTAGWRRAGFTIRRREWEYVVPTDPRVTGLEAVLPPSGVTIVPAGQADESLLRAVDRAIRDEVEATVGWQSMPAEVIPRPEGDTIVDPSKYAVAAAPDHYLGLIRVVTVNRRRASGWSRSGPASSAAASRGRCSPTRWGRCTAPGSPRPGPKSTSPTKQPRRCSRASAPGR